MDTRAVRGIDKVDTKRNRRTAARAEELVHSHQHTNAIRELEIKDIFEIVWLASRQFFLTSSVPVTVTRELCLEIDTQCGLRPDARAICIHSFKFDIAEYGAKFCRRCSCACEQRFLEKLIEQLV